MLGELIVIALLGYAVYYTYKYLIGTMAPIITGIIALYVCYLIYTQVLFMTVPSGINIPEQVLENDKQIEQTIEDYRKYEYRDRNQK